MPDGTVQGQRNVAITEDSPLKWGYLKVKSPVEGVTWNEYMLFINPYGVGLASFQYCTYEEGKATIMLGNEEPIEIDVAVITGSNPLGGFERPDVEPNPVAAQ